jgi:hypothetical protein
MVWVVNAGYQWVDKKSLDEEKLDGTWHNYSHHPKCLDALAFDCSTKAFSLDKESEESTQLLLSAEISVVCLDPKKHLKYLNK